MVTLIHIVVVVSVNNKDIKELNINHYLYNIFLKSLLKFNYYKGE